MRRDRLEIMYEMLSLIRDNKKLKPTHLMYKANLSHEKLKKYTQDLVKKGLVRKESAGKAQYFVINDEGLRFLQEIKKIKEFADSFGI